MGRAPGTLLIRADAGAGIGSGHVMRCLALAQAWRSRGGRAHFHLGGDAAALQPRLESEGMSVSWSRSVTAGPEDAVGTLDVARGIGAAFIVTDGYPFTGRYQKALREGGAKILAIDDNGECAPYHAHLILNQNVHAAEAWYRERPADARLLLGTRYAMLRQEFLKEPEAKPTKEGGDAFRILVSLGGGDPDNATLRVIRALRTDPLRDRPGLEARVVVGMLNPNLASLEAALAERSRPRFSLHRSVTDMPGLMAWADLAVSAAGSTTWELMHAGLPTLLMVVADNQRGIAAAMAREGAAVDLGWHADSTPERIAGGIRGLLDDAAARIRMARRGKDMVDGLGAARVADALAESAAQPGKGAN